MNRDLAEKIRKLLSLASNNSNESESQSAMLKAQELMVKHNLSMADVEAEDSSSYKEVVDDAFTDFDRRNWWHERLAGIIAKNFRCEFYTNTWTGKGTRYCFIGLKDDVDYAKQLFYFAVSQIEYLANLYVRQKQRKSILAFDKVTAKNDYITGFLSGLNFKFNEQVEKQGWGLILVKDEAVIEAVKNKGLRIISSKSSHKSGGDIEAYRDGYKSGKEFAY